MRFTNIQYLEKETVTVSIRNNNATAAILDGQPVFLENNNVTSVNLGVDVRSAPTANGTSLSGTFVGIAKVNKSGGLLAGDVGEAVCYGFTDAIVQRRTRTATSATWPSISAIGAGDQMAFETVNGFVSWVASQATTVWPGFLQAGESTISTGATEASSLYTAMGTVETLRMKVFVRAM